MSLLAFCSMRIYQGILHEGYFTHIKSGTFRPNQIPYFKTFNLQSEKGFQSFQISETKEKRRDEKLFSKFTNNEFKSSESSSKREVNAERNKAKSTVLETNRTKYTNYKLKEGETPVENKRKDNEIKKFRITNAIADHDLQIKTASMLKYLEKGKKVYCEVINASNKNDLENALKKLNNTPLKDYLVAFNMSQTKLGVVYEKKVSDEESKKVQNKEIDKSS